MLSFEKLVVLGSAAPHVYVMYRNISGWLTVDYLISHSSHCLSHLLPPEKHHLGLRATSYRGHSYTLPICPNKLCKSSFIPRCLFCFLCLL